MKDRIDEIEHKIACHELNASQVFTQMRQLIDIGNEWAEEAPKEDGWYWVKTFTGNVTIGFFCGDLKKTYMPSFNGWELFDATRMEWYGPLTPPS